MTIDDLAHQAQELVSGLQKLGTYKHPLDVRRGIVLVGKGVMTTMKEKKGRKESAAESQESQENKRANRLRGPAAPTSWMWPGPARTNRICG